MEALFYGSLLVAGLTLILRAVITLPLIWCLYITIRKLLVFLDTPGIDRLNKQGAILVTVGSAIYGVSCLIGLDLLLLGWIGDSAWWANPFYFLAIQTPGIRSFIKDAKWRSILLGISTLISLSFLIRGLMEHTAIVDGGSHGAPILPTLSIPDGVYCIYWLWLAGISLSFLGSLTYRPVNDPAPKQNFP
jgi:hypothetical protein